MMMRVLHFWGLLLVLVLLGCASGKEEVPLQVEIFNASRSIISDRTSKDDARPVVTRADLDQIQGSFMEVTIERQDIVGYVGIGTERRDDQPGKITVWRTEDDVSLAMRNGVLIATRGMGGDVISSSVQVSDTTLGPSAGGEHVQVIRDGDDNAVRLSLACELVDFGSETITIIERQYPTRHLQQRCQGGGGSVVNDYWVDSRAGLIWQSRQWAGPYIGYMRIRRLTR